MQVFNSHTAIRNMQVVQGSGRDDSRLIVVADDQVQSLKLHRCNSDKITSCRLVSFIYYILFKRN